MMRITHTYSLGGDT